MAVPTVLARGFALRCPRAPHRGLQHEAALIKQDNGAPLTPGIF